MTNREKAREIGTSFGKKWNNSTLAGGAEIGALEMAEWKDQQFKEYLEKKMAAKLQARESFEKGSDVWWDYTTSATAIEEIINELFKED